MSRSKRCAWLSIAVAIVLVSGRTGRAADTPGKWTLELSLHGSRIEGTPLAWSQQNVFLL